MEGCCQCIVAGVTAVHDLGDWRIEVIGKRIGFEVEGPRWRIQRKLDAIGVYQLRHHCDFDTLYRAVADHVGPCRKVSGDFPGAVSG